MDDKDILIEKLLARIAALELIVAKQAEKIAELERRLNKNSQNSSKPPTSDSFKKKPQNNREKTNKKTGGQKGHEGKTLTFAEPDIIIHLPVKSCAGCSRDLTKCAVSDIERRQVHDIPPIKIHVTEYQAQRKACPCGHSTIALFPEQARYSIQYGATVKGLALYLHNCQKIPYKRCCMLLNDYYGTSFSEGSLFNTQKEAYGNLEEIEVQICHTLIDKPVLHGDESGVRVNKKIFLLHVASSETLTAFSIHHKRGKEGMDAMDILPTFTGILVHDHWLSYFNYLQAKHGLCNAHHLRELKSFEEEGHLWAAKMRSFLKETCHVVNEAKRAGEKELSEEYSKGILKRYKAILAEADKELPPTPPKGPGRGKPKQPSGRCLYIRLRDFQPEILRFVSDFSVPFTNNQAERDIRMIKLKQKISGCFRSLDGAKMFARISAYLSTLRKQNINIADAMTALARGQPILPSFS